ncbi:MAG TPA: hypothetical protein VF607_13755, partial [Verrucomicrobiae bacterium]
QIAAEEKLPEAAQALSEIVPHLSIEQQAAVKNRVIELRKEFQNARDYETTINRATPYLL